MGTSTRTRQGKKPAKLKDLPAKPKRAGEVKGGAPTEPCSKLRIQ